MMSLVGLNRRHPKCKICTSFNDEILNQITLDISTQQRTWNEIIEYYNQFLPASTNPLNVVNLNSHKKHIDVDPLIVKPTVTRTYFEAIKDGAVQVVKSDGAGPNDLLTVYRCPIRDCQYGSRIYPTLRSFSQHLTKSHDLHGRRNRTKNQTQRSVDSHLEVVDRGMAPFAIRVPIKYCPHCGGYLEEILTALLLLQQKL